MYFMPPTSLVADVLPVDALSFPPMEGMETGIVAFDD
jgi:hypothetical protein